MKLAMLIIETGQIEQGANSYATLEEADAYCALRSLWPENPASNPEIGGSDELPETLSKETEEAIRQKEAALIRAFDWLNTLDWLGEKLDWQQQTEWPRKNVPIPGTDPDKPEYVPEWHIPHAVVFGQIEMAALIYAGHNPLEPLKRGGKVISESHSKSEGGIDAIGGDSQSDSYTYSDSTPVDTWYPAVLARLAPFLATVPGKAAGNGLREAFRG